MKYFSSQTKHTMRIGQLKRFGSVMVLVFIIGFISVKMYAFTNLQESTEHQEQQVEQQTDDHGSPPDYEHAPTHAGQKEHPQESDEHHDESHDVGHEEGQSHGGMEPLLFVILALMIGAATRHFLRKSPLPYTVMLLVFGLVLGLLDRFELLSGSMESFGTAVSWAGEIDPHLILYVFLPTLIFEAAFALDVHIFKKSLTNAAIMAIPGILVAMFLTAALVIGMKAVGLGLNGWGWSMALMFGAVVCATDPVAVVSLLKELGASKKLGTLIEGESLLNDGTAIVIFMVFFLAFTGEASDTSPVIEFFRVAVGGVLVGIGVGVFTITWVRRVFNDALVEISVIVAAAYLTFFIAEHFLHVSGVLGLVAFGLAMASVGRTRISPEVEHFLHEFWELAAFIANTLIFLIVGVVIAYQARFTAIDVLILILVYIGIHIVRAIVIFIFFPVMKNIGYGLPKKDAYVVWWGALRGAIGLALALVVAGVDDQYIGREIREQFLFYTAGIVTMTLLINATTIKWLITKLGLNKVPPAKALMIYNSNRYLRQSAENHMERIKTDRFMNRADWRAVKLYLPKMKQTQEPKEDEIETMTEMRRRILEKEKSSYWRQFKEGLIGHVAVQQLAEGINEILDRGGQMSLSERADLEESWRTPKFLARLQNVMLLRKFAERAFYDRLSTSYDSAAGFIEAQEEALKLIESMYRGLASDDKEGEKYLAIIEEEINENRIHGLTFLRNIRKNYPEIYNAIATRQAIRSMLNYEIRTVERLQKNGRVDSGEAHKMIASIEERMKRLMDSPPKSKMPENLEILMDVPWLNDIDKRTLTHLNDMVQSRIFAVGDDLIREGKQGDCFYIIARGTVKVQMGEEVVSVLGPGSIVGEMSVLNGNPRTATITAESPVTALRIRILKAQRLFSESDVLLKNIWELAGQRFAENLLSKQEPFNIWRKKQFKKWLEKGEIRDITLDNIKELKYKTWILLSGSVTLDSDKEIKTSIEAPAVISQTRKLTINNGEAKVFVCAPVE